MSKKQKKVEPVPVAYTLAEPYSVAAIWPHVRPVTGRVAFIGDVGDELLALWKGPCFQASSELAVWSSLVVIRQSPKLVLLTDLSVLRRALEITAPIGGTVAALLPLSALRRHADWMIDHRPDVYVLPTLYGGQSSAWFVWSRDRGRARIRFLRPQPVGGAP